MCEIRWHGRGGQGAVTSAQILAEAAYHAGYRGVTSAPYFGAERRGAPVSATTRFSPDPIRVYSEIETPDVVVVLDESLLRSNDVASGLKQDGCLIVNTSRSPGEIGVDGRFAIATANATQIAHELGLAVAGVYVVNTAILGAFVRATGLLPLETIRQAIRGKFSDADAERNYQAAQLTFERTLLD
ncbi:MAG: 2-oxoacid:acceptor oxidoreductase family protein [Chloroflexota bacterium]|nr:2-oxoacid:acceptor oxidoreductase family protein [Chloroflexota bacterium]